MSPNHRIVPIRKTPGIYVEETPLVHRTIEGVSLSDAVFVGEST